MKPYLTTDDIGNLVSEMVQQLFNAAPGYTSHVLLPDNSILSGSRGNCQFSLRLDRQLYNGWLPHYCQMPISLFEMSDRLRVFTKEDGVFWPFFASPWSGRTRGIARKLAIPAQPKIKWASEYNPPTINVVSALCGTNEEVIP